MINLEKKLLQENKLDEGLDLAIKEANKVLENSKEEDLHYLKKAGLSNHIYKKEGYDRVQAEIAQYTQGLDPNRIFTDKQIENVCKKYHLKFLPTKYYKGNVGAETPRKIKEVEKILEQNNYTNKRFSRYHFDRIENGIEYFICAPSSSFELQKRPKDPLLFVFLSSGAGVSYYYLIDKWGGDLSIVRRLIGLWNDETNAPINPFMLVSSFIVALVAAIISLPILIKESVFWGVFTSIIFLISATYAAWIIYHWEKDTENYWNSHYRL